MGFEAGNKIIWFGVTGTIVDKLSPATYLVQLDDETREDPVPIYESEMVKVEETD